ncbi:N-acetylmuramoyl-L-alanine amidase [Gallibacter intestinalis]|uniref:N-acetylmuramoyl-L-alanine amidase n=1 Tax=Gallibacter intestinalis TaxID=2779356 RepID=A0ABR9QV25_9FIRM|nr:N-acetylmuramoyl-L-alanine amidase [Gallibacter intestinalis]MBE5034728.1 N-acetylmuramoyl-L-alanine amidase [Gallibacter intestinalis]
MNKIKRSLAILLIIGLVITGMPINMANAAENNVVNGENTNITVVDDNQSDSNTATDDEQDETIKEEDAKTTDEGTNVSESQDDSADIQLNYIYVESPKVTTPGEQNIVVSLGGNFDDIENVKLNYQKDNGKTKSWKSSDSAEGAFLFTKDFKDTDTGVYDIVSVSFEVNGATKEIVLKEMGHEAHFGVNEEYKVDSNEVLEVQSDGSLVEKSEIDNSTLENENTVVEVDPSDMEQVSNDVKSAITNQIGSKALSSRAGDDKLIIYLDPGHDNTHTGSGHGSLREEKLNLQIAQYCRAELEQYSGVEVRMTRSDSGACPYPGTNKDQCLLNRIDDACDNGADAYVSIHLNASGVGANGAEVWYWYNNATGNGLANKIQNQLVALGLKDRGAKPNTPTKPDESDTYAVTRECKNRGVPGIIVEHAFMDGSTDYSFLSNPNNIEKLGVADAKGIVNYFGLLKGEWIETSEGRQYQFNDGTYAKGYIAIEGKYYYFNEDGYMQVGYQKIDGKPYQFYTAEGYGYGEGWINYNSGEKAYCLGGGELATGYTRIDNKYYYFGTDGYMQVGHQMINGKPYQFYTEEGYGYGKGWINYTTGEKAYCLGGGELAVGIMSIDGKRYGFDENGYLITGYTKIGDKYYYFDVNGNMQVGHQIINGKPYQFYTEEGYGYGKGWINYTTGEKAYCLGGGELVVGHMNIEGKSYYFDSNGFLQASSAGNGIWQQDSKGKKYQYNDGTYAKGYIAIEGKYYYFDSNGYLCGGYQKINGQPYQFYMEEGYGYGKGWINYTTGEKAYCLGGGELTTGYTKIDNKYYYFGTDGFMRGGYQKINGKPYQFYTEEGYGYGKGWINYTTGEKAYCLGGGELATGYTKIDNKYYYFGTDGFMRGGYQKINGKPYQFYTEEGYGYGKGWINYTTGEKAYCLGGGELATGYTKIDNKYYYFGTDGFMCGGYQKINGKPYQFYTEEGYGYGKGWINYTTGEKAYCLGDGELATGYIEIGNKYYYFGADGYMLVGHQIINGKPYQFYTAEGYGYGEGWINYTTGEKAYCLGGGELVTGTTEINGVIYSFNSDGYLVSQSKHSITGKTNTTVEELVAYYEKHSPIQYSEYYAKSKDKEATTLEEFCRIYIEEATIENINVEVAFCQAMKETGWLQFGGAVKPNQFNFAGIGAIDSAPQNAASFENARQGIRAQIQHLKAYANTENLINTCVDPRFNLVTRGSAPYVEDLGGKWASDKNYGFSIVEMMQDI